MGSYKCCNSSSIESIQTESLPGLLKVVSESNRLKLLCILRQGSHCVSEVMEHVNLSQSLISHHLSDLRVAEMVECEKKGSRVYYSLTKKGKHITNLLFKISLQK